MKNLLISGLGNVGKYIYESAENYDFSVACCIDKDKFKKVDCPIYSTYDEVKENIDVIIDFSSDRLCSDAVEYAIKNKCVFLTGTTALSEKTIDKIHALSRNTPVCLAANFSKGMLLLYQLAKYSSEKLNDFDGEIIEAHNRLKKDAPSGTAKELMKYTSITKTHSLRGGNVAGIHSVCFYGKGEEITITHRAYDKSIFAQGALLSARKILDMHDGLYSAEDLLLSD